MAGGERDAKLEDPLQVVVYSDGPHSYGLVVDRIEDIVHATIRVRRHTNAPGITSSVVVGDRVVDVLDVPAILQASGAVQEEAVAEWRAA